jgi:hypothetical protein
VKRVLFETDWLASTPVFYNELTRWAGHNVNEVIDYENLEFDPEGFCNYLDFGYSVLEQTPVKHVKFLRHSSRLTQDEQGSLSVEYLDDPVEKWLNRRSTESDVLDLIRSKVSAWEHSVEGDIVVPTSGGLDTRLLNWMIEDKKRVRSFTFGVSENQSESYEVVYARRLSELLGTRWMQVSLGDFHTYFGDWDRLFGISTHAHGMYQIEFYSKMATILGETHRPLLSGIIGDAWAGNVRIPEMNSQSDTVLLGYTHGMSADPSQSMFSVERSKVTRYWETHATGLRDPRLRVIEAMRFKIILLCYLMLVPRALGFQPWSPFLDIEVAMAMLNLPPDRRSNRLWQREFFRRHGLDFESMAPEADRTYGLDMQALRLIPLKPLDANLLGEVIKPAYVEAINRDARYALRDKARNVLRRTPGIGAALRRLGYLKGAADKRKQYNAYLVLRPIENLLGRRDLARRK